MKHFDAIVIGGGILGCMTVRNLRRWQISALLVEKEEDVCLGITRANSAIVYPGYDNKPGSLKAELTMAREIAAKHVSAEETAEAADRCVALEQECAQLRAELEKAQNRCAALEQTRDQLSAELETAGKQLIQASGTNVKELETYRRAERVERMAQERAAQVYRQTTEILSDAASKVDAVAGEIGNFAQQVTGQLAQLQSAVVSSKTVLHDTAATIATLQPEAVEE